MMSSARERSTESCARYYAGAFLSRAAPVVERVFRRASLQLRSCRHKRMSPRSSATAWLTIQPLAGKEQIAAALQAIAQDPLFVALLKSTQSRRDEAYTDKGAKKTAKGSVFKAVAERVRETRDEKERFQRVVTDSEGAENLLRDLMEKRDQRHEALVVATERTTVLERFAVQSEERAAAKELVRLAQEDVQRIQKIGMDVEDAERRAKELLAKEEEMRQATGLCSEAAS